MESKPSEDKIEEHLLLEKEADPLAVNNTEPQENKGLTECFKGKGSGYPDRLKTQPF